MREALEGSIAGRVCRNELWNVSQMTGWQIQDGYLVTIQPVGADAARDEAIRRWSTLPTYIDTEVANLREGLRLGYSAPKVNVRIIIGQMDSLLSTPVKDSPFDSPSLRDKTPEFQKAFDALVGNQINPAIRRYRDFLEHEYLPAAREATPVSANPDGAACYDASIRFYSSLPVPAKEVHALGLEQIDRLTAEMKTIAERSFHTSDVPALLQQLRTDPKYTFTSREELISYSQAALASAKAAVPRWFGIVPKADVVIQPYPAFREKNGRTNTTRRRRTAAARGSSSSTLTIRGTAVVRDPSRSRSTKRSQAITCRSASRSSGRRFTRSDATSPTAAMWKAGRCTPSAWPTK